MWLQVPTDGKPVRGLIQDHVIAAVRLTKRDTFLSREEFSALAAMACVPEARRQSPLETLQKSLRVFQEAPVVLPPPAVLLPKPLWTGKQVCTPQPWNAGASLSALGAGVAASAAPPAVHGAASSALWLCQHLRVCMSQFWQAVPLFRPQRSGPLAHGFDAAVLTHPATWSPRSLTS